MNEKFWVIVYCNSDTILEKEYFNQFWDLQLTFKQFVGLKRIQLLRINLVVFFTVAYSGYKIT